MNTFIVWTLVIGWFLMFFFVTPDSFSGGFEKLISLFIMYFAGLIAGIIGSGIKR